jgi:hypothetical protein
MCRLIHAVNSASCACSRAGLRRLGSGRAASLAGRPGEVACVGVRPGVLVSSVAVDVEAMLEPPVSDGRPIKIRASRVES